ncbi:MAG: nucleotidyltransferase domain-containing protein [Spirochaetota bacterium]
MRLSDTEKKVIKKAVFDNFGRNARVFLFGSRVDDTKRGGDIDLVITIKEDADENRLVVNVAREEGVEL